ncbi:CASP-like protein 3A1 [Wolffia australiana]
METEAAAEHVKRGGAAVHVALRLACAATSAASLALLLSSEQSASLSFYGFHVPLHAKWSFSDSFQYLAAAMAAAAAHSLVAAAAAVRRRGPQRATWLGFAADQAVAYAVLSASAAAAGVTNINRTGIRHVAFPNFCRPLWRFCGSVAASVALAFLTWLLLATSALLHVIALSRVSR